MGTTRTHTMTMFRDNADTNVMFMQNYIDGYSDFNVKKVDDDKEDLRDLFALNDCGFALMRYWAFQSVLSPITPVILQGGTADDLYDVKIAASAKERDAIRFTKCFPGGKKTTVLVLTQHQTDRLISWLKNTRN